MEKLKEYKAVSIVMLVLILGFFYWFQIRPSNIRKGCSWTTETIEADPGVTKEQAENNKHAFEQCKIDNPTGGRLFPVSLKCSQLEKDSIERQPQSSREEVTEATNEEYNACLKHHGL